jgi:hypothetical protein
MHSDENQDLCGAWHVHGWPEDDCTLQQVIDRKKPFGVIGRGKDKIFQSRNERERLGSM